MRESPDVIRRFARYYLSAGAAEVLVYHDGPPPDLGEADLPGLVVVACDADFWSGQAGGRPEALEDRQAAIYRVGLDRCRSDWLLVVDADEYVFGDRPIGRFLDGVPDGADAVLLPTAEAVWGPGDDLDRPFGSTCFRTRWRSDTLWRRLRRPIYGEVAHFMRRGLVGHIGGKMFLRAGREYSVIRNNAAERGGVVISRPADEVDPALRGMYLGHFDAIGPARWTEKWRRRIERETLAVGMTETRTSQMAAVEARLAEGDAATRALFRRLYALGPVQFAVLRRMGLAFRRDIFAGAP